MIHLTKNLHIFGEFFFFFFFFFFFAYSDFAARSCLVMGDNTVKLGDYGLTRQIFKARNKFVSYAAPPFTFLSFYSLTGGLLLS